MWDNFRAYLRLFASRRIGAMLFLGFSSGLPLALTNKTLQAWFTKAGVDIETIGFLTLVAQPYAWKFVWAPLMDRYIPPLLGRRRGWMLVTQVGLVIGIGVMAFMNPTSAPLWLAAMAFMVAFMSASQDISFNAYMVDVLEPKERGMGAALQTWGYRAGMLIAGGGALIIADYYGWQVSYLIMAALMGIGICTTLLSPRPEKEPAPVNLRSAVVEPFREFLTRPAAIAFLFLVVLYKMGDAFGGSLSTTFLLRGVGFTLTDVGGIYKIVGTVATVTGVFYGGALLAKLGLFRSLLIFGVLQSVSMLGFMVLALVGKNYALMIFAIAAENVAWGMGTAAFLALLMALCNHRYAATQFALLTALDAVGRTYVGPAAGFIQTAVGWAGYFLVAMAVAVPGLVLVCVLKRYIEDAESGIQAEMERAGAGGTEE